MTAEKVKEFRQEAAGIQNDMPTFYPTEADLNHLGLTNEEKAEYLAFILETCARDTAAGRSQLTRISRMLASMEV